MPLEAIVNRSPEAQKEDERKPEFSDPDAADKPAAGELQLSGEAVPDPSHPGEGHSLTNTPANGENSGEKPNKTLVLPVDSQEVYNVQNPDAAGADTTVAGAIQLPGDAAPTPSHPEEGQGLKNTPAETNGESSADNEDDTQQHDPTVWPVNSQEKDLIKSPDAKDGCQPRKCESKAPEVGYESFVQGILGCLVELRNANNNSGGEETDQAGVKPNGDDERDTRALPNTAAAASGESGANHCCAGYFDYADYFEPALFEIVQTVNGEAISGLDDPVSICYETPLEVGVGQGDSAVNDSNEDLNESYLTLEMDNYERHLSVHENSVFNGIGPVDHSGHTYAVSNDDGTLQTKFRRHITAFSSDFHNRDIKLPLPENLREHRWLVANAHTVKLGASGYCYIGDIGDRRMHGFGRLLLGESGQFMEGTWRMNRLVELHSCQLICDSGNQTVLIIKRQNDHLLTIYENHYIARVAFKAIEELDFTASIAHLKRLFFRKLTVLELVADELELKKNESLQKFATLLSGTVGVDADPIVRANTFILLSVYLGRSDTDLSDIFRNRNIPLAVRDAAADLVDCENRYLSNSYVFSNRAAKLRLDLRKVLVKIYNDGIAHHRQMLIDKCPSSLPSLLSSIRDFPASKIVYVTGEDMRVFDHIVSQPCFEQYRAFFANLVERFSLAVRNIRTHAAPSAVIPVMSPVYGFLVKSFWEIISEIIEVAACYEYKDMLKCESGKWKLQESIEWPENEVSDTVTQKVLKFFKSAENKSSLYHRTLEIQYSIIFQMLANLSPENYVVKRQYQYDFHMLEQDLSWWEKGLRMVNKKVGLAKRLQNLSTERIIWLCLLDQTIHEVFKDDPKYQVLLKPYNALLQGQVSFIEKSSAESHETFRVMTHSVLKFITSTAPYFREAQETPGVDVEILVQQMWTFSTASQEIQQDPTTFSNFRDLIAEYNRYLSLRLFINIEAESGHFSAQISQMMQTFMRIVVASLKKSVPTTTLVSYLRSLNDFLDDFKNIDFLAVWFVKSSSFDPEVLEEVDNKLSGGNRSYRVIDIEKFVQVVQAKSQPIPRHHIVQVVSQLLGCIETCLDKQWQSGDADLQVTQLKTTALLLDAARKSFMYLKEQPDYVDFEIFEKESIDPFVCLVRDCETLSDLKNRTGKVSESFWYIRKMDEIGIDRALDMFKNANSGDVSDKLFDCYDLYLRNYNEYIAKYRCVLSDGKSHAEGLNEVKQTLGKASPMHFSMWTEEFKTKEIPVMLAGLSAVWSILVSKDVSSTGKFLKPHCIQVLCVLRLLSVDLSEGADNHLAQVLTGQGKSVILGLLSSILALTGHKVRVLCYSEYLSTRDQKDFDEFFRTFQLADKIEYGTFKNMANSFLNPILNGRKTSLRQLVEDRVMNHTSWPSATRVTPISKNTVLLIDEVDVFFTEKFYGNGYYACTRPGFFGLAKVQELIWSLATTNPSYSAEQIAQLSRKHIDDEVAAGDEDMLEFNAFLDEPGTFPLLEYEDHHFSVKRYTNRSLFDNHLLRMVKDALNVRDHSWARSGYALTANGMISKKDDDGKYSEHRYLGYRNVFNYFRLKESDYDFKDFSNYGYFNLRVGEISYARLPSQFQLILGVSGTLTNLGDYEKSGIQFYGIHNFSVLPSFFGESNLEFDEEANFHCFNKEQDWLKEIYDRANSIVESRRAVLIFFESDNVLDMFTKEYKSKFDRMNEITENVYRKLRDAYIDEAGLSCTVTLATRGMGRGVDYKSSLSVEKNGGVHVIQTFFSIDVKEEVQIKGRTARKDNKGSYELIICREHLVKENIIPENDQNVYTYWSLGTVRKELSEKKGKTVNENIQKSERNHNTTMKYFGLI